MATNISKAAGKDYRGIAIPDPRFRAANIARADSTLTEANPRPGVPVASQNTALVLETSGGMGPIANLVGVLPALVLTTNRGGMPGLQDGRFTFAPNYSIPASHESAIGWDAPVAIARQEIVYDSAGSGTTCGCIRLQNNDILLGVQEAGLVRVSRKTFNAAGYATSGTVAWTWGGSTTISFATTYRVPIEGTLCFIQLPEGRVHAYYMVSDITVTGREFGQLVMSWSDDNGATWNDADKYLLDVQIGMAAYGSPIGVSGYDIDRVRVAYSGGEVLLLIAAISHDVSGAVEIINVLFQYASSDLGTRFQQIDLGGSGANLDGQYAVPVLGSVELPAFLDVVAALDGAFVVSFSNCATVASGLGVGLTRAKRLGTAFTKWTDVTSVAVAAGLAGVPGAGSIVGYELTGVSTSIAIDETGLLTILSERGYLLGEVYAALSYDAGATWQQARGDAAQDTPYIPVWESGDVLFYPSGFSSTFQCGRLLVFTLFHLTTGGQNGSLDRTMHWELQYGGNTTSTRSFKASDELDIEQVTWEIDWVAAQRMTDTTGWAFAGTGTEVLGSGNSALTTAGGQTITLTNNNVIATGVNGHRVLGMCEFRVTVGLSRQEVLINNGATDIQVYFEQSPTNCLVRDIAAGTTLYNAASPSAAGYNQFLYSFDVATSRLMVWLRASDGDSEARVWRKILDYVTVATGAIAAASRMRVDQPASSTSYWRSAEWTAGQYVRPMFRGAASGSVGFLDTIAGRAYSSHPVHIYSGDGVRIRAVDGPSWDGDIFTITQRRDYGIENVFAEVSPSPRRTWRSVGLNQQDLVVTLDNTADPGPLLGSTLCIGAFNCNFQALQVSYRTAAGGAWTALGTLFFNAGQTGLRWIRDGHMIRPNTAGGATSAADYFTYNILEDSHIQITAAAAAVVRAITRNSEGAWVDTAAELRPTIYAAGSLSTDDTSGTAGEIWSKDGVILIHDMPDAYQLKFTIPVGITAEGYFEIGTLFAGHVAYFGRQYARGRNLQWDPNYNLTTGRGGSRRAQALGPSRRSVEFSWSNEGETDTTQIAATTVDVDYITSGGTNPVASPADTSYKMAGLVEHLQGATTPCIYLSKIPVVASESTDTTMVNRNLFLFGRIVSAPRIETVLGDEWATELVRIATVTFEEEV